MYFPWVGMFEQIRLCDVYIHYDDVQFSKGSFTNRVQIKTAGEEGFNWMTVPLKSLKLGAKINEVEIDYKKEWRNQHLALLKQAYKGAPFAADMMTIVDELFATQYVTIGDLSKRSMELIIKYFDLQQQKTFLVSSELPVQGSSTQRVFDLVKLCKGTVYITGHGAKNYLDHQLFEDNGIIVEYMDYRRMPYPQLHGPFNPHVSILDLIANTGKEGKNYIISTTKKWREFVHGS
jgi:hypothetical protein